MRRPTRRDLVSALSWAMLVTVVAAALALIVVPKLNDARPLTVLSGSMSGTYEVGDAVIVRPVDPADLRVGDVITFQPVSDDPSLTTHRITAIAYGSEGRSFITQGDANGAVDPEPITEPQVMGKVWYSVPKVGYASVWMAGDWARTAIHVLAGLFLLYGGYLIASGIREHRQGAAPRPAPVVSPRAHRTWPSLGMNRSFHLAFASAGVLAVAASLILVMGPPARAAEASPKLLVGSSAGGPFRDQLPSALFADADLVAPGAEVGDRFWVKNNSSSVARVRVSMVDDEPDNELEAATSYELTVGSARTATSHHTGPCQVVVRGRALLAPGEVRSVDVTARVGDLEDQAGMGQVASVDLVVTLTQTVAAGDLEVCGDEATDDLDGDQAGDGTVGDGTVGDGIDCSRDVVVTTAGTPTCVPTVVDAGVDDGRSTALDTRPAAIALGILGGMLLIWAKRRRERECAPQHRA